MQEPYKEPPPDADSGEDTESEVGWEEDDSESSSSSSSSSTDDSRWGLDPSSGSSSRVRVSCVEMQPSFVLSGCPRIFSVVDEHGSSESVPVHSAAQSPTAASLFPVPSKLLALPLSASCRPQNCMPLSAPATVQLLSQDWVRQGSSPPGTPAPVREGGLQLARQETVFHDAGALRPTSDPALVSVLKPG